MTVNFTILQINESNIYGVIYQKIISTTVIVLVIVSITEQKCFALEWKNVLTNI